MPPHRSTHAPPPVSLPSLHVSARAFCCHKNTGTSLITFVTISPTSGSKLPFIMNHFLCSYSSCWHDITVTLSFIKQLFSLFFYLSEFGLSWQISHIFSCSGLYLLLLFLYIRTNVFINDAHIKT